MGVSEDWGLVLGVLMTKTTFHWGLESGPPFMDPACSFERMQIHADIPLNIAAYL